MDPKFFNLFRTDTFSVCHISSRFSDGVPLIFMNQSLFDEFHGITLNYCFNARSKIIAIFGLFIDFLYF